MLVVRLPGEPARRRAERAVLAEDGRRLATLRPATPADRPGGLRGLVTPKDQFRSDAVELGDAFGQPVLTLLPPIGAAATTLVVRDPDGRETGRITTTRGQCGAASYTLSGVGGSFLGGVRCAGGAAGAAVVLEFRRPEVSLFALNPDQPGRRVVGHPEALSGLLRLLNVAAGIRL